MQSHYHVYGLHFTSNIEIPGLDAERVDESEADIEINMGFLPVDIEELISNPSSEYHLDPGYNKNDPPDLVVNLLANGEYFHFYYVDDVEFVVDRSAQNVWGRWSAPLVLEDVALYLLGPIIGFMLRLRGITCLHASGAIVDGYSFALTGPSGAGKSTLAASLAADGYHVLTDDVLPLGIEEDAIYTRSGYSRLRLFPNSFENLQELPDTLPLLAPSWNKCFLDLSSNAYNHHKYPSELKVIYIIDWSMHSAASPSIETLSGASALALLAANTYRNELLSPEMRANEFVFLSQLLSKVKVKKLYTVSDIFAVPQLRDMLIEDFRKETQEQSTSHVNASKSLSQ